MIFKHIKDIFFKKQVVQPQLEIFMHDNLGPELMEFYKYFIKLGNLCFDIGANIGERTDIFLQLGAKVVCVEPQRECITTLDAKYQNNPKVQVLGAGVASQPGTMTLSVCKTANTISTFSERWKTGRFKSYNWDEQYDVPVTTLDELIEKYGMPDFCKVDVEGFELEVMRGLSSPMRTLSFEFTYEFIDEAQKCIEHLESLGHVQFNYALGDNLSVIPRLALSEWCDGMSLLKELRLISSPLLWGDIYACFTEQRYISGMNVNR